MPSIKDAIRTDLSGYTTLPSKPPVLAIVPTNDSPSTNLRCPLPPFNADPDTLRQFDNPATGPKNRVWPQPQSTGGSGPTSTVIDSTSSAPAPSPTPTPSVAGLAAFTTGLLIPGFPFRGFVAMSESFQLLNINSTVPCEVRLYGTAAAQAADAARVTGAPVPPEVTANIISCVTFDTVPYTWGWQNRCGSNQSSPQTTAVFVSVFNTSPLSEAAATITISYLPFGT